MDSDQEPNPNLNQKFEDEEILRAHFKKVYSMGDPGIPEEALNYRVNISLMDESLVRLARGLIETEKRFGLEEHKHRRRNGGSKEHE